MRFLAFTTLLLVSSCATTHVEGRVGCTVDESSRTRACVTVGLARRDSLIHACDGMSEDVESASVDVVDRAGSLLWRFSSTQLAHAVSLSLHDGKERLAAVLSEGENQQRVVVWGRDGRTVFSRALGDTAAAWAALSPDGDSLLVRWEALKMETLPGDLTSYSRSGTTHVELFPLEGTGHAEVIIDSYLSDVTAIWSPDSSGVHVGGPTIPQRWLPRTLGAPPPSRIPACAAAPSPTQALLQLPRGSCGHFELTPTAPGARYSQTRWMDAPAEPPMLPACEPPPDG